MQELNDLVNVKLKQKGNVVEDKINISTLFETKKANSISDITVANKYKDSLCSIELPEIFSEIGTNTF